MPCSAPKPWGRAGLDAVPRPPTQCCQINTGCSKRSPASCALLHCLVPFLPAAAQPCHCPLLHHKCLLLFLVFALAVLGFP